MSNRLKSFYAVLRKNMWLLLFAVAAVIVAVSVLHNRGYDFTEVAARRMEKRIDKRLAVLDSYMQTALNTDREAWPELDGLPRDMVVYRYIEDSLQSWKRQFTLDNDDLTSRVYVQQFASISSSLISPLADVDTALSYMNLGPKWYLVRKVTDGKTIEVIGGLEIKNTLDGSYNGVNPRLKLSDRFAVYPISDSGGAVVRAGGEPMLKVIQENAKVIPLMPDVTVLWIAIMLVACGILMFLSAHKTLGNGAIAIAALTVLMAAFFIIGRGLQSTTELFSPTIYADGQFFYSLGAVLIVNLWIVLVVLSIYIVRVPLLSLVRKGNVKVRMAVYGICVLLSIIILAWYIHSCFRSLIFNSNITFELYKIAQLSKHTAFSYLSLLSMLTAIPLLAQLLRPVFKYFTGLRFNAFSRSGRAIFSILSAVYLVAVSSLLGFRRETNRVEIWGNRLAIDRNLAFEIQLRGIELSIVADPVIPRLIGEEGGMRIILNRLTENYFSRISQDYDISLALIGNEDAATDVVRYVSERLENSVPIADSSRFAYKRTVAGRPSYTGVFPYYSDKEGPATMVIGLESKADHEDRGYSAIMGNSGPGSVVLPQRYSYGHYLDGKLVNYKGEYAYPTVLSGRLQQESESGDYSQEIFDKYVHFMDRINDDEVIFISRPNEDFTQYLVAGLVLMLVAYTGISLPMSGRRRRGAFEKNYYKQRINALMFLSLVGTLIAMAVISVLFVYKRNEANVTNLMTGKINTIQSLINAEARYYDSYEDFGTRGMSSSLDDIGNFTKSDISLYTTSGRIFASTYPEIFERMLIGSRVNEDAFRNIMYDHRRYYIHKERVGGYGYYSMYAPVFNDGGKMIAIVSAPYTDSALSFKTEAVFHAIFIVAVFFLLVLLTRFLTTEVVNKMFGPLIEMGRKMNLARTKGLEYIIYDREDEISSLVRAYNLMVHDLSESSKQVAAAERNKAWSEMARQVAHEIKNPLTPIKLQIQRIIRLKQRNDPDWETKFDSIVPVIMDSIDGLTDTANEFSTFAKLYSEEPVEIDLDTLARDQIVLFDEKDNITFQYFGLQGARIKGPKPQLTRVFVNLLTNAVQAIENQQKEMADKGLEPEQGMILLSLRNSSREGFYDVVFEDNGPGVKDEDRSRLFTPNFTTKSSGTGLGLAICKNILELCGGEIQYSKSFSLQGACFTVRIPKLQD